MDSVKERIELQLQQDLAEAFGIDLANVQRLDDTNDPVIPTSGVDEGKAPEIWITIDVEDEDEAVPDGDGDDAVMGEETVAMPFVVSVHLTNKPAGLVLAAWANRHIATTKQAVMTNNQRRETATNQPLALMTLVYKTFGPIKGDRPGEKVVGVEGVIRYRHPEGDPYTVG